MPIKTRRFLVFVLPLVVAIAALIAIDRLFFAMPPLPEPAKPRKGNALDARFVVGANLPWLSYGQDFGSSGWGHRGISLPSRQAIVQSYFEELAASGVTVVRWFVLCDGRSGLRTDARGDIVGLDEFVMLDLQAALDAASKHDVQLILVLLDFHFLKPAQQVNGVQVGGRRYLLDTPARQDAFIEKVFVPLFKRFGQDETIAAWEVINEPEWVTSSWRIKPGKQSLPLALMQDFIRKSVAAIHEYTLHYATVGSAARRYLSWWQKSGLDLIQFHFYPHLEKRTPYELPASQVCPGKPCIVGEFPTANGRFSVEYYISVAQRRGYRGVFFWSYDSSDRFSSRKAALTGIRQWRAKPFGRGGAAP